MSTTSSATASGRDCDVPSAEVIFKTKLCLVSLTRRDGTLMDASYVSEEDIVEICITKGHTHPLGVLCYSAMELVILFHSPDELQHATCRIVKEMELQGEAITVKAMAPSEAHTRAYLVMLHLNPSNGEGEPHTHPQQTPPSMGTLHCLQVELRDLANHELHQLVENLTQEIAQSEVTVPPSSPLQIHVYAHWGVGTPRRMTRRSPFQKGEGGVPQGNPLHFQSPSNQLEEGFPLGPPLQAPCPAPSGSDMGQLITTLASDLHLGTPKINTFSGDVTPSKIEVSYEQWNQEVQCIKDHYPELVVWENIMRSLKGAAADMAQYMGPTAGVSYILDKLTVIFRTVALFDVLMQNFYKITQGNNKKVPSFTTRLEGTLNQIRLRWPKQITDCEVPWHLKEWLFHGFQKYVRDFIRYLYGNSKTTYSELVIAAHWVESKMEETKERFKTRSAASTEVATGSRELRAQIARLMDALTRVEQGSHPASVPNSPRHRGDGRGQADRNTPICPSSHNGQTGLGQTASICSSSAASRESTDSQWRGNIWAQNSAQGGVQSTRDSNSLQYFRCQVGVTWQGSAPLQPKH